MCFFIENEEVLEEVRTKLLEAGEPIYKEGFSLLENNDLNYLFCSKAGNWWLISKGNFIEKPVSELENFIGESIADELLLALEGLYEETYNCPGNARLDAFRARAKTVIDKANSLKK